MEPPKLEEGRKATLDELQGFNLWMNEDPRPMFISKNMSPGEKELYVGFLK